MAVSSKTRNLLENLVREGSFKWLLGKRSSFDEEFEEMGRSPSACKNWISELSPLVNIVVRRCSKILGVPTTELQESFNQEASNSIKHPSRSRILLHGIEMKIISSVGEASRSLHYIYALFYVFVLFYSMFLFEF